MYTQVLMRDVVARGARIKRAVAAACCGPRPCVEMDAGAVTGVPNYA